MLFCLEGFISGNKAKAECRPGWFARQIVIENYPGCPNPVVVEFCVWCSITSPMMEVEITRIYGDDDCVGFLLPSFIDYAVTVIKSNYFEFCPGAYIPCEVGVRELYIRRPMCMVENSQRQNDFRIWGDVWCVERNEVCVEPYGSVRSITLERYILGELSEECRNNTYRPDLQPGTCFRIINIEECINQ